MPGHAINQFSTLGLRRGPVADLVRQAVTPARPIRAAAPMAAPARTVSRTTAIDAARPLLQGETGIEVQELQAKLRRLGKFHYPTNTGFYGPITAQAVRDFQLGVGLPQTGDADPDTRAAIDAALAAMPEPDVPAWHSEVAIDGRVQPKSRSTIPGWENEVEQCGEFAYRYFRSQGKRYPTLGQPHSFLMTGKDHVGQPHPEFERHFNGTAEPPRAGDILVAKGPRPGQYHTAIITKVDAEGVHVLQANVPWNWQGGKEIHGTFALEVRDGMFHMPPLPTSQKGYRDDYPVIGWIRPTGENALPPK